MIIQKTPHNRRNKKKEESLTAMANAIANPAEYSGDVCGAPQPPSVYPKYWLESALSYDYVTDEANLSMAATAGEIDNVRKYLAKGADVSSSKYGSFIGAAMNGHVEVLELLISSTKDVPLSALKEAWEYAKKDSREGAMLIIEQAMANKTAGMTPHS